MSISIEFLPHLNISCSCIRVELVEDGVDCRAELVKGRLELWTDLIVEPSLFVGVMRRTNDESIDENDTKYPPRRIEFNGGPEAIGESAGLDFAQFAFVESVDLAQQRFVAFPFI